MVTAKEKTKTVVQKNQGFSTGSLCQKYRPRDLDRVVGQSGIKAELTAMFKEHKIPPVLAILGESGLGKTTLARIIARTVNEGEESRDIVEENFATDGSIENVRRIIEQMKLLPQGGNFRVFILDEFHRASYAAINALLKPLEDPPRHVLFIICSSEGSRIPFTVKRRSRELRLEKVDGREINMLLRRVAAAERMPKALLASFPLLVDSAKGNPSTALNLLDKLRSNLDQLPEDLDGQQKYVAELMRTYREETDRARILLKQVLQGKTVAAAKSLYVCFNRKTTLEDMIDWSQELIDVLTKSKDDERGTRVFAAEVVADNRWSMSRLFDVLIMVHHRLTGASAQLAAYPSIDARTFVMGQVLQLTRDIHEESAKTASTPARG